MPIEFVQLGNFNTSVGLSKATFAPEIGISMYMFYKEKNNYNPQTTLGLPDTIGQAF